MFIIQNANAIIFLNFNSSHQAKFNFKQTILTQIISIIQRLSCKIISQLL